MPTTLPQNYSFDDLQVQTPVPTTFGSAIVLIGKIRTDCLPVSLLK
jgi:hypothetical protein